MRCSTLSKQNRPLSKEIHNNMATPDVTSELKALRARIEELEAAANREQLECDQRRTTRRQMLRLASSAAVGGIAAAAVAADPVAATDGAAVLAGVSTNTATLPTGVAVAAAPTVYGLGCYESGLGALDPIVGRPAIFGHATQTAFTIGVSGHSAADDGIGALGYDSATANGIGVRGYSVNGTGIEGYGDTCGVDGQSDGGEGLRGYGVAGALRLDWYAGTSPPNRGQTFVVGVLDTDQDGNLWYCYEGGTPGKWRKLAGVGTAGAFHPTTPTRVYDSRAAAPHQGTLASGNNRTVSVADGRNSAGTVTVPNLVADGATAVAANVTVTGTVGSGYLTINPGGNTAVGASTINWSTSGLTIANGVTLSLNAARELTVICGGVSGSTHFIIDIAGYFR